MTTPSVEDLKNSVDYLKGFLDDLKKEVSPDSTDIDNLKTDIEKIKSDISNKKGELAPDDSNLDDLEDLENVINQIENDLNELMSTIPAVPVGDDTDTTPDSPDAVGDDTETAENGGLSSVAWGAIFSGGGYALVEATVAGLNRNERIKMRKTLDGAQIKAAIKNSVDALKGQIEAGEVRLSSKQKSMLKKHIAEIEKGLSIADDDAKAALKARQELDSKIPLNLLEATGLTAKQIEKIEEIAPEISKLKGKPTEIKALLEGKGINLSDEMIEALSKAKNLDEVKNITIVLKNGKGIAKLFRSMKGLVLTDVVFGGFDVWNFVNENDEAKLIEKTNELRGKIKKDQAYTHLYLGAASVVADVVIGYLTLAGSIGGVPGFIAGAAIAAGTFVAEQFVDRLIFDPANFYSQNKTDYLKQSKSSIIQAILQGIHNQKKGNYSLNESFSEFAGTVIPFITAPSSEDKKNSLRDAYYSLFFLDELDNSNGYAELKEWLHNEETEEEYLKKIDKLELDENAKNDMKNRFHEDKKAIEEKVNKRMEYIEGCFENNSIIEEIYAGNGIDTMNKICMESRIYAKFGEKDEETGENKRKTEWKGAPKRENFSDNLTELKKEFFKDYPNDKVEKIEKIKTENPTLFQEMITVISLEKLYGGSDEEDAESQNYKENVELLEKYKERFNLTKTNKDVPELEIQDRDKNVNFIEKLIKADFDINNIQDFQCCGEDGAIKIIDTGIERMGEMEFVDDVRQNVLYRFAKEFFNYAGNNTTEGLMSFFNEKEKNTLGIYFGGHRTFNDDNAKDNTIEIPDNINETFKTESDVEKYAKIFMLINFYEIDPNSPILKYFKDQSLDELMKNSEAIDNLDTPTEAIDTHLNKEYRKVFEKILKEELMQRTKGNQDKVKQEIIDFVKKHSNGEYLEIPYYLLTKARRAGLGDLQRQFVKRDNNQLEICQINTELGNNPLGATKINYISKAREDFTDEEKYYIDRAEEAKNKLTGILAIEGDDILPSAHESELDMPKEVKGIITKKIKERNAYKEKMLLYGECIIAGEGPAEKAIEYAEYFENIYRGILIEMTTFNPLSGKLSNDIDTYELFSNAETYGYMNYFGEKGELKVENLEFFNNDSIKNFYNDQIAKQKVKYKTDEGEEKEITIKELREIEDKTDDEKKLAKQASNMIISTILEVCLVCENDVGIGMNFNFFDVNTDAIPGGNSIVNKFLKCVMPTQTVVRELSKPTQEKVINRKKEKIEKLIPERLEKMKGHIRIDREKVSAQMKEKKVVPLSEGESQAVESMKTVQDIIEETCKDIEWQDRRGDIIYDPEKKIIKSRGEEIKIEVSSREGKNRITKKQETIVECKLEGLSDKLDIEEGIWLANFRNRARNKYKGKKIEVGKGKHGPLGKDTLIVDANPSDRFWTRIISREALDKNLPSFKSDAGREKIAKWLTKQIA